jgi:2-methylisocitrate lyase-like PEP mutase family enzyme
MRTQIERARLFRALHERPGLFLIPNAWDAGSAKLLASLGFEAIATTSLGLAAGLGRTDGTLSVSREALIANCRAIADATDLPVSADLENGYADDPREAATVITSAAQAGVVGGSIEDATTRPDAPIYDFALAVERVAAAVEAARALPFPFTLTARAENFLHGRPDLDDTIRRLQAYADAGADVLYAPGLRDLDSIREVVRSVSKPINLLSPVNPDLTMAALAEAGVKRVSVGGALARRAYAAVRDAAIEMRDGGTFGWVRDALTGRELNEILSNPRAGGGA